MRPLAGTWDAPLDPEPGTHGRHVSASGFMFTALAMDKSNGASGRMNIAARAGFRAAGDYGHWWGDPDPFPHAQQAQQAQQAQPSRLPAEP